MQDKYKIINGVKYKKCSKCLDYKPISKEYYINSKDTKEGIASRCKSCTNKPKNIYKDFNNIGLFKYW
jgi:hypothetical protein